MQVIDGGIRNSNVLRRLIELQYGSCAGYITVYGSLPDVTLCLPLLYQDS